MFQTATIWNICQDTHRRYRFTGEAERFACWLRPKREQPESHKKEIGSLFAKKTYLLNFTYIYDKKRFL